MHPDTQASTPLAAAQEHALRDAALSDHDWTHLAFFYWVRRDEAALRELQATASPSDANLRAFLALALPDANTALSTVDTPSISKPWILYYLARERLGQGDFSFALHCAKRSTEIHPSYTPLFPLILREAYRRGEDRIVHTLRERLLTQCPEQADFQALDTVSPTTLPPITSPTYPPAIGYYVPVYNAAATLGPVLDSLMRQAYPLAELVVVNDGATDASVEIAERYPVTLYHHEPNRGLAAARNTALNHMQSPYVGSCDSDAILEPDYLIYAALELHSATILPVAIGGRMNEHYTDTLADAWRDTHLSQDTGIHRKCSGPQSAGTIYIPGCNTVVHRETVLALGGYDERHVAVGEDGNLTRRLHRNGETAITTPLARCFHLRRDIPLSALNTRWNYEAEGHAGYHAFDSLGNIGRLFREHLDTAIKMGEWDLSKGQRHLLPMEILYVYVLFMTSLEHGRKQQSLTLGQRHWFEQNLLRKTLGGNDAPSVTLRQWRDAVVAPLQLHGDCPLDVPPTFHATLFLATLDNFDEWIQALLPEIDMATFNAIQ